MYVYINVGYLVFIQGEQRVPMRLCKNGETLCWQGRTLLSKTL